MKLYVVFEKVGDGPWEIHGTHDGIGIGETHAVAQAFIDCDGRPVTWDGRPISYKIVECEVTPPGEEGEGDE